jgi:hypothetical protein
MHSKSARSALDFTAGIIDSFGPRLAGTEACRRAADLIAEKAGQTCDSVRQERFAVHPGAFLGFIKVLVVFYVASALGLSFLPVFSAALITVGIVILVFGFLLYKPLLDPFFPKKEGINVIACLEPTGEVKRQLIVSGHHDSARIFNFYVDRPELYSRRIYGGIGSVVVLWLAAIIVSLVSSPLLGKAFVGFDASRVIVAALFLAALPLVLPLWKFASDKGTPGAGDNLIASASALEIVGELRRRRDSGNGLAHTRVVFASFDAEEAGLRGARAFARARRREFATLPSYSYNMDCVYTLADLHFLSSDLNGSVAMDEESTNLLCSIAKAENLPDRKEPIAFLTGGTDAAELAKAGVKATSLISMKWGNDARANAYHTPADTVDAIESEAVEAVIRLGVAFARELDARV